MADNVISNLSIVVNTNADEVAGKFRRLTSAVSGLGKAASDSADDMEDAADAADDMGMQTQEAGIRIGHAESFLRKFARALTNVSSRVIGSFVDAMKGGIVIIGKFIKQMARIAMIRAIRSMIKDIAQSFKDLYGWSRMFGTEYAKSMDRINTAAVYLRNSFAAMVAPIINALAPAIDVIVDKIVDLFNFVNQIFAALSGAGTYTVAKKVAQTWESTFDSTSSGAHRTTKAVKELKRTLLGFDEINKLDKNSTPSSGSRGGGSGSSPYTPGYSTMFEEKPLEGFFKQVSDFTSKMPPWLKWLFGGAALVGGFLLISKFIPWLLKKIGELFSINIPDWLKWLFGPKGKNNPGLDIPDHIDIPDGKINVDLEKGDWSALDDLNGQSTSVSVDLEKAWEGASPGVWAWNKGHKLTVKVDLQPAWEGASPGVWAWNKGHKLTLKVDLQKAWEGASPAVWAWNLGHDLTLKVDLQKSWEGASPAVWAWNKGHYLILKVDLQKVWKGASPAVWAWNKGHKLTLKVDLQKAWEGASPAVWAWNKGHDLTLKVDLQKAWKGASPAVWAWNLGHDLTLKVNFQKGTGWDALDGFGGAEGGGGHSSGSGAGRRKWTVDVDLQMPTKEKSKGLLQKWWDSLKWSAKVEVGFVGKLLDKSGKVIDKTVGKVLDWIFPGAKAEDNKVDISVGAVAGYGLQKGNSASKGLQLKPIAGIDSTVDVSAEPGNGLSRKQAYGNSGGLKLSDVEGTKTKVSVGIDTVWSLITGILSYLGLTNLSTTVKVGLVKDDWSDLNTWIGADQTYTVTIDLKRGNWWWGLDEWIGKSVSVRVDLYGGGGVVKSHQGHNVSVGFAEGGVITQSAWRKMPKMAGGGSRPHGTMFVAGEAGPEIVGHINSRTEVLNQSQLAQTMFAAVRSAMSGVQIAATMYDGGGSDESDYEMMYRAMYDAYTDAMARGEERDREKVALMREIAAKDFTAEITTASMNRAQLRMNRRAGTTIVPVGT